MIKNDVIVSVDHISKCYHTYATPRDKLKKMLYQGIGRLPLAHPLKETLNHRASALGKPFWALKDVSFSISKGQTLGILGQNGAGKSTLLQLITGTVNPTMGTVTTHGKIAALLELGSGFNPAFTGLQNVYLNARLLGLSREQTDEKLQKIMDFADIGEFIHSPVQTYSNGMVVRLAFAVQAQLEPDILIIDEALAVGDAKFQAKCFARLRTLVEKGTTVLFVSHSTEQIVTHCDSAILLDKGKILEIGEPRHVVNYYLDHLFSKKNVSPTPQEKLKTSLDDETLHKFETRASYNSFEYRWGDRAAEIVDFELRGNGTISPSLIEAGDLLTFFFDIHFHQLVVRPIFGFKVKTKSGITIYGTNTEYQHTSGHTHPYESPNARGFSTRRLFYFRGTFQPATR